MQTDEELKKRIAYEKMLAGISEQAVSVYNLDDFLSASLKSMGSILDVSRIFIFTYQPVSETFACICEWVARGITTLAALDELIITIPWGTKHLKNGKIHLITRTPGLYPETTIAHGFWRPMSSLL